VKSMTVGLGDGTTSPYAATIDVALISLAGVRGATLSSKQSASGSAAVSDGTVSLDPGG
jgi:hypothetical protein